jgi:DNA helicase-2/ATP-dependent DNA helicase PcrA
VPTQLVGSAALLGQPAVVDLRSTLEVVLDPSANPAFVRLAAGPRWRIGPRDLAALGDRAAELAGSRHRSAQEVIEEALDDAVAGTDVVEVVSLSEALEDPGDPVRYSADALARFGAFAAELAELRSHVGEPLTDFLHRVLRTTGLEVEAWLGHPEVAELQHHAVHAFVDVAAEFIELDGRQGLGAFLSFLRDAERFDLDLGFEPAAPQDAVQLLTVHKAKGLEYPYVFVPFVSKDAFPGGRGRGQWPTSHEVVPWPIRDDVTQELAEFPPEGETPRDKHLKAYRELLRDLADLDARRLAYVAFTRAERGLVVSGHWWGPSQTKPRGPSEFLHVVREACEDGGGTVVAWAQSPEEGAENPLLAAASAPVPWPLPPDPDHFERLRSVASAVRAHEAQQLTLPGADLPADPRLTADEHALVAEWSELSEALIDEANRRTPAVRNVRLPESISASLLARVLEAEATGPDAAEQVAWDIVRPMPRPPAPAARRGTEFHAWVESRFGQQSLIEPEELPGAADEDITSDEALAELKAAFEGSEFAGRVPVGVEVPFALLLGGRVVNGRIDAVFDGSDVDGTNVDVDFDVIDWKTGSGRGLDPMQLAIYRLAWSQRTGVPVERISAGFYIVGTGELRRPDTDRALATLLRLT